MSAHGGDGRRNGEQVFGEQVDEEQAAVETIAASCSYVRTSDLNDPAGTHSS